MYRFPWIASYCGPQWMQLFANLEQVREQIKHDVEEASIWEGTNFTLNESLGTQQTFQITPFSS